MIDEARAALLGAGVVALNAWALLRYLRRRHRVSRELRQEEGAVAVWTVDAATWRDFTAREQATVWRRLRWLCGGGLLLLGLLFMVELARQGWREELQRMVLTVLGAYALLAGAAWLAAWWRWRRQGGGQDGITARISREGLRLGKETHVWTVDDARVDAARLLEGEVSGHMDLENVAGVLEVIYSYPAGIGRQRQRVRMPVPPEALDQARLAEAALASRIRDGL